MVIIRLSFSAFIISNADLPVIPLSKKARKRYIAGFLFGFLGGFLPSSVSSPLFAKSEDKTGDSPCFCFPSSVSSPLSDKTGDDSEDDASTRVIISQSPYRSRVSRNSGLIKSYNNNHTSLFACGSSIAPVLPLSFSAQAMQDRSVFRSVYFPLFAKDYFHACLVRELYQII